MLFTRGGHHLSEIRFATEKQSSLKVKDCFDVKFRQTDSRLVTSSYQSWTSLCNEMPQHIRENSGTIAGEAVTHAPKKKAGMTDSILC